MAFFEVARQPVTLSSGDLRSYEGHGYDRLWYRQAAWMGFLLALSVGNTMLNTKKGHA